MYSIHIPPTFSHNGSMMMISETLYISTDLAEIDIRKKTIAYFWDGRCDSSSLKIHFSAVISWGNMHAINEM